MNAIAKKIPIGKIAVHLILLLGAVSMLLPFIWMLATSFKPPEEVITWPPTFIPKHPTIENYIEAFQAAPFHRFFPGRCMMAMASTPIAGRSPVNCGAASGLSQIPARTH